MSLLIFSDELKSIVIRDEWGIIKEKHRECL